MAPSKLVKLPTFPIKPRTDREEARSAPADCDVILGVGDAAADAGADGVGRFWGVCGLEAAPPMSTALLTRRCVSA